MIIKLEDGSGLDVKYLLRSKDRHGNVRIYVRRYTNGPRIRIRALANVEEFMAAYRAALESGTATGPVNPAAATGSLRWLVQSYYRAPEFTRLHETTRAKRRAILDGICIEYGAKPFARMETKHVTLRIRDPKAATPEAANGRVKALRTVFRWAMGVGHAKTNPARGVELLAPNNPYGFHTWTRQEIDQFKAPHPSGTRARKAMALFLYTGVRISDAVRLGPQMEKDGTLCFTEQKNRANKPKEREVPILPPLRAELDASPSGHLAYLVTEWGRPYATPKAFGNRFKAWYVQAGLPHCSAHGLRKAGATFAAEQGATEHELMAIYGWESPKQAALYTRKVDRAKVTKAAMPRVDPDYTANKNVPLEGTVEPGGTIRAKKA